MDARILEATRLMERNIGEDTQIDAIASEVGLSLHHFHRLFVSETGETPAAYLRRIRMVEAAFRLKWADESTEDLSRALGFRSRPAFIRAFQSHFSSTPAAFRKSARADAITLGDHAGAQVFVRELEPMRLLSRRYTGDIKRMRAYWNDFSNRLPEEIARMKSNFFVGMIHDDPRVTEPEKVRYDCAIALSHDHGALEDNDAMREMNIVETYPGTYAGIRHLGHHEAIPHTYDLLCTKWIIPSGRSPAAAPALEIHTVARHEQDPECVDLTILVPIE